MTTVTATMDDGGRVAEEPLPRATEEDPPRSWAEGMMRHRTGEGPGEIAARGLTGMALAGVYGLAMGVGAGAAGMWAHVLTVLAVIGSVVVMAVPALHVLLALLDAPISPVQIASRSSQALFRTGLLLAGLAPAVALYTTTTDPTGSALLGVAGLYFAGAVGLDSLVSGLARTLLTDTRGARLPFVGLLSAFTLFTIVLVVRISAGFPVFGATQ